MCTIIGETSLKFEHRFSYYIPIINNFSSPLWTSFDKTLAVYELLKLFLEVNLLSISITSNDSQKLCRSREDNWPISIISWSFFLNLQNKSSLNFVALKLSKVRWKKSVTLFWKTQMGVLGSATSNKNFFWA